MSTRLFTILAAIAVVATIAGVLVFQSRRSGGDDSAFGGKDDPVLDAKIRRLQFYDWEANVIGPGGRPAPGDPKVTGGVDAGRTGAITLYEAVMRAAARPAAVEANNGREGSIFILLDRANRTVVGSAFSTRAQATAGAPAGAAVAEIKPDTTIVEAEGSGSRFYVLKDDIAITGAELRDARQGTDQSTRKPVTLFAFSDTGRRRFRTLTKKLASRGSQTSLNNLADDAERYLQHFVVVYQGQIVTAPFVDFRRSPDGLDPAAGIQLAEQLP